MELGDDGERIHAHIQQAFGGPLGGAVFHQEGDPDTMLALFRTGDPGRPHLFSTYGLTRFYLVDGGAVLARRFELVGGCRVRPKLYPRVLVHAAFHIVAHSWPPEPGFVLENGLGATGLPLAVPTALTDLIFAEPTLLGLDLPDLVLSSFVARFLAVVPIAPAETALARRKGPAVLLARLGLPDIDLFDLARRQVV